MQIGNDRDAQTEIGGPIGGRNAIGRHAEHEIGLDHDAVGGPAARSRPPPRLINALRVIMRPSGLTPRPLYAARSSPARRREDNANWLQAAARLQEGRKPREHS